MEAFLFFIRIELILKPVCLNKTSPLEFLFPHYEGTNIFSKNILLLSAEFGFFELKVTAVNVIF